MSIWLFFAIYVAMSATGLILLKLGTADTSIGIVDGILNMKLSPRLIIGFIFYVCSFLLSLYVMSQMNLSLYYPIGTGALLVITCVFGYFFLKEHIGAAQIIGMVLILAGVISMNINR